MTVLIPLPERTGSAALAERDSRFLARLLDNLILLVPAGAIGGVAAFTLGELGIGDDATALAVLAGLLVGFVAWIVQMTMLVRTGQTLGKRLMQIRVLRRNGDVAGFAHAVLLREVLVFSIGVIPLVGRLFALADSLVIFAEDRLCLHDRIADTVVVDTTRIYPTDGNDYAAVFA